MDLTTKENVKALGKFGASIDYDDLIDKLISAYSQSFETYLGRRVLIADYTEVWTVKRGSKKVALLASPLTAAPTSVKYGESRDFTAGTLLSENTDYEVDTETGLITFRRQTALDPGYVQVIYNGGMAANTAGFITAYPAIASACDLQVYEHFNRRQWPDGNRTVDGGSASYTSPLKLLPSVVETLELYRRHWL